MLLLLLLGALFAGLGATLLDLPSSSSGLVEQVEEAMDGTGVTSGVTAVLLDFRGYDTLLEMAVLLLALIGVWSLSQGPPFADPRPGVMLDRLARLYTPLMLMVAGYLLWSGSHAPGGAFQAGAVLGAAGVVLTLTGWRLQGPLTGWPLRFILVAGVAVFIGVGLIPVALGGAWLNYPKGSAVLLVMVIEVTASLSIGATLAALFLGARLEGNP